MSLFGGFEISTAGLTAQAHKIKTTADNVSNARTPGHKARQTQFSSMKIGGVIARQRLSVEHQGNILLTNRQEDLAINGKGFFLVRSGAEAGRRLGCTRSGDFYMNKNGIFTDGSGYRLQGQRLIAGEVPPAPTLDALNDIRPEMEAVTTNKLRFSATLDRDAEMGANELTWDQVETTNTATNDALKYVTKIYDPLGQEHELAFICGMIDPATANNNTWGLSITPSEDYTFQFKDREGDPLAFREGTVVPFKFDGEDKMDQEHPAPSLEITWADGKVSLLSMAVGDVHLEDSFKELNIDQNGHAKRDLIEWNLTDDGIIEFSYDDGATEKAYQLLLATCANPDAFTEVNDGVYFANDATGDLRLHLPGDGLGTILSSAQESSTVDIATELSDAIVAQHIYSANGKVLSTISNMLEVLERL